MTKQTLLAAPVPFRVSVLGQSPAAAGEVLVMKQCSVPGCAAPHHARGFCDTHYAQLRHGKKPHLITQHKWSEADVALLQQWYHDHPGPIMLSVIGERLGRSRWSVAMKAARLGITNQRRLKDGKGPRRTFLTGEMARMASGAAMSKWRRTHSHPKGMKGKKHSDATKRVIAERSEAFNAALSIEEKDAMARKAIRTKITRYGSVNPWMREGKGYSRCKGGKRADLDNRYFRSGWEANYARYLNWLMGLKEIAAWEYEPDTFVFHGVTRGAITYTPDFKIAYKTGVVEYHEIKGWMDSKSKTRLRRMAKYYPDVPVRVVGEKEYNRLASQVSGFIPHWE